MSQHPRDLWRVQFVSKAIVPPFRDGTKCLVRDLCLHLSGFAPHVLGAGTAPDELEGRAHVHAVYGGSAGQYTPTLLSNLRAFAWLLASEPPDLFHFVFAPNPRTSLALRLLGEWTRVPCVQTVASAPRTFERPDRLFSGDVVVAQSHDTARRIHEAFALAKLPPRPVEIIPPPAPELPGDPRARTVAARAALGLAPNVPLVVYPGDLEVSRGAAFTVELARRAEGPLAAATFVVAYRRKTAEVDRLAHELEAGAPPGRVVFRPEVDDVHALLAAATAVVFPVEDLYGKVDLPIVLLEALSLGVPVLVLDQGPLAELEGARRLPPDPKAWLDLLVALLENPDLRAEVGAFGPRAIEQNYAAPRIAGRYAEVYRRLLLPPSRC